MCHARLLSERGGMKDHLPAPGLVEVNQRLVRAWFHSCAFGHCRSSFDHQARHWPSSLSKTTSISIRHRNVRSRHEDFDRYPDIGDQVVARLKAFAEKQLRRHLILLPSVVVLTGLNDRDELMRPTHRSAPNYRHEQTPIQRLLE